MKKFNQILIFNIIFILKYIYFPNYILKGFEDVFNVICLLSYIIIIIMYLKKYDFKIPNFTVILFIMQLIPLISTIYCGNYDMLAQGIKVLLASVSLPMLIKYNYDIDFKSFIKEIMIIFGILVSVNVLTFYIYYPSMTQFLYFYFLGNDNGSIYETFLYIYISIIYYLHYKKRIPVYFYVIVAFLISGYVFVRSGNSMVCLFVTATVILLSKTNIFKKVCNNEKIFMVGYIVFFLLIVIFRNNSAFMNVVLTLLDKNPTFTGRTFIWDYTFKYIKLHPLIGNGYENSVILTSKIHQVKAHNLILQYLYMGGLFTLTLFLYFVYKNIKIIKKGKIDKRVKALMQFSIFLFFIISVFDYYYYKYTFIIMILVYYYINLESENKNE